MHVANMTWAVVAYWLASYDNVDTKSAQAYLSNAEYMHVKIFRYMNTWIHLG